MLSCLRETKLDGGPRRLYASAGGLYPVQTYLHMKPGRVEQIDGGMYYHDPITHRLVSVGTSTAIDRHIHDPFVNRSTFDEAAFSVFLVGRMHAIVPVYDEHAERFATLEAGLMAQLLDLWAPEYGIGLCHIGALDSDGVRDAFELDPSDVLLASLVGGASEASAEVAGTASAPAEDASARAARLLQQVRSMSPSEATTMLRAQRRDVGRRP